MALFCLLWPGAPAVAAPPSSPLRVLFLGNSLTYTNDMPGLVQNLANSAGDFFTHGQVANAGWDLAQHATNSLGAVSSGNYDLVLLQQYSTGNVIEQDWAVQILNGQAFGAGARSMFFNTPSWDFGPSDEGLVQFRQQTAFIRYNYALEASLYKIAISPAGLAWQTVRLTRSDINLYSPDGHPSLAGSYLMACVHYATMFGRSPAGNSYTANVADAAYLQSVAEAAVFQDPWAVDLYGYGPNRFYWAKDWSQYASDTTSALQGTLISGAGGQSSPSVKVDSAVGQTGNLYLGVRDDTYPMPGQGRLYLYAGGSLQVTGNMVLGKEGRGFVEHRGGTLQVDGNVVLAEQPGSFGRYALSGGTLSASQILAGFGTVNFTFTGGRLSFHQFGNAQTPMSLYQSGGTLAVNALAGTPAIHGNFTQSAGALLERVVGATGTLDVTGTATLAGGLAVTYPPGFTPVRGWTCPILTASALTGTFSQITLPPTTDTGVMLTINYSPTAAVATAIQDTTDTDGNGLPDWWERRVFGVTASGKTWSGDFNNTGVSNGVAFAVGCEPASNPVVAMPRFVMVGGVLLVRFVQRTGGTGSVGFDYTVDGLTYTVELCGDLTTTNWLSGSDLVELVSRNDNGNGTETVFLRPKTPPGSDASMRFARLVVRRM